MARGVSLFAALVALLAAAALGGAATQSPRPPGSIVYSVPLGDGRSGLFVARADGSGATRITDGPDDFSPRWSPDGRRIVFVRSVAAGVTAIWVVDADGTEARQLDVDHPYAEHPRWSPNGRWIAYQVQTSTHVRTGLRAHTTFELWLVRPDGSGRRRLVPGPGDTVNENALYSVATGAWAWSPGGGRIAFVGGSEGTERVRIVDVVTGKTRSRGPGWDVAWSPDGKRVAVTVEAVTASPEPECGTVWIVPRDRGKRRLLARPPGDPTSVSGACDLWARWAPDGRSIAFVRSASEGLRRRLMIARPDGSHVQRVRPLPLVQYRWPATCGRLFEYASGYGSGWIVRPSARAAPRFVRFPVGGRPACDPDSEEPCASAGDWHC
jgi:Tol biopolymer transport system component